MAANRVIPTDADHGIGLKDQLVFNCPGFALHLGTERKLQPSGMLSVALNL